jgi:integrase/recombinase XerC/integrase/recombinase XerD
VADHGTLVLDHLLFGCGAATRRAVAADRSEHQRDPWTLYQLRHALTHLAEDGVNLPLLMAKSGHEILRSLRKYARPGAAAVAVVKAAHDPARRRRCGA